MVQGPPGVGAFFRTAGARGSPGKSLVPPFVPLGPFGAVRGPQDGSALRLAVPSRWRRTEGRVDMPETTLPGGLELVREAYKSMEEGLRSRHPTWDRSTDARPAFFGKVVVITQVALQLSMFQEHQLTKPEWWSASFNPPPPPDQQKKLLDSTAVFLGQGYYFSVFSVWERCLRTVAMRLDPSGKEGVGDFKSIFSSLLAKTSRKQSEVFFDLLRLWRNTNHTNGLHVSRDGKDRVIEFDGKQFPFRHMQVVDTRDWGYNNSWEFI